ncbi:MAG: D-alanyl-D-alanine carboxypeptidase [Rhodospirillales bacterium]|nr:D-alanyl-D-alanine carboxypeptidase [Rhodospirillales bacterium]
MTADTKRRSRLYSICAAFVCGLVFLAPAPALAKYASLVMDAATGRILHASNPDDRKYPASLTKMMTLFMLFEAMDTGRVSPATSMPVSKHAASQPPSKLGLKPGQSIKVEDAIQALAVKSANDVAAVVGEYLGGTEQNFARAMTIRARQLGMTRTTFRNASGLPDAEQLSTARDMATLARALIRDFPHHYHVFSAQTFSYGGHSYRSHNRLLGTYSGADGIKTGYIRASGYNLVASVKRDGRRLIGVVFGGKTSATRNTHMAALLDQSFGGSKPTTLVGHRSDDVWGVQVGAFSDKGAALRAARNAARHLQSVADDTIIRIDRSEARGKRSYHLARILNFSKQDAYQACRVLKTQRVKCLVLRVDEAPMLRTASALGARIGTPTAKPTFAREAATETAAIRPLEEGDPGDWGVQVGAFMGLDPARDAARDASATASRHLASGMPVVVTQTSRNHTMFLSRVHGVSKESASLACRQLRESKKDCMVLRVTGNAALAWAPAAGETPTVDQGSTGNAAPISQYAADWGVQVGVVATEGSARKLAEDAVANTPGPLESGNVTVVPLTAKRGSKLYRAQVVGITKPEAYHACRALKTRKMPCMVLRMRSSGPA